MAEVEKGLPDIQEPEVATASNGSVPGVDRLSHEKGERGGFDRAAFLTLSAAGIICGICMWVAFSYVGGSADPKTLVGAIFGGWLSGLAIFSLS